VVTSSQRATAGARYRRMVVQPKYPAVAEVPAATGAGSILFALLAFHGHLDLGKIGYDPVADRVLLNMLQ